MANIFFTIVEPENRLEHRIDFEFDEHEKDKVVWMEISSLPGLSPEFKIDSQQIAELGHLLISISGGDYDMDSVEELIAGYAEEIPHVA